MSRSSRLGVSFSFGTEGLHQESPGTVVKMWTRTNPREERWNLRELDHEVQEMYQKKEGGVLSDVKTVV